MSHLETRELKLGGYRKFVTKFFRRDTDDNDLTDEKMETFAGAINVHCYTATSSNPHYLGPCDIELMAEQIVGTSGSCGPNSEYVLRLARFLRENIPEDNDPFLFALETKITERLEKSQPRQLFSTLIGHDLQESINDSLKIIKNKS